MAIKSVSIRFESEVLDKLHYISDYEDRSVNSQINAMVKKLIREFEKEHGEIRFGEEPKE